MNKPLVSVIMAEYNTNPTDLRAAIASILKQSYQNFEFIIIDDCGQNDLQSIVSEFGDRRIKTIRNRSNRGLAYSMNNAIKHAKSEYLVRMDTDDTDDKNRIEILHEYISKHPEYDVVSCRAMEFAGNQTFGAIGKAGEKTKKDVMRGDTPIHAAAIMRKSSIEDVGGYDEKYPRSQDLALWCELLLAGKRLYMLDDVLYNYRVNQNDYKKRTLKHRKDEIRARLNYYPKLGAGPIEYVRIIKSIVAGILPLKAIQWYRSTFVVDKGKRG
jgi:glycosyltransferase EpsE